MAAGAGPAHALYFGSYEWLKVRFSSFTSATSANTDTLAQGAAATVATCFHDGIMTPAEGTYSSFRPGTLLIFNVFRSRSGEAAASNVQQPLPIDGGLRPPSLPDRGNRRLLSILHHSTAHERALPGSTIHRIRKDAKCAEPGPLLQSAGSRHFRRSCRNVCISRYHAAWCLQNPFKHAGVCYSFESNHHQPWIYLNVFLYNRKPEHWSGSSKRRSAECWMRAKWSTGSAVWEAFSRWVIVP